MLASVPINDRVELDPLVELTKLFSDKISEVDRCLKDNAYSEITALPLVSSHIISSGGKRIRPLLTLAGARLCGYADDGLRDVHMAACIEFLHTATLLHDDVIDESSLRRGKPTAHTIWGNQMSILTGDFLFTKLFSLLVKDGSLDVLNLFVQTTQKLIEGEVLQVAAQKSLFLTREGYFAIIEAKTAVLFGAALELGARVANSSPDKVAALKAYAYNIGMAFQLIDDILDYVAPQPALGKPVGNDFFEGQITLPLIILSELMQNDKEALEKLTHLTQSANRTAFHLQWVQELLLKYNVTFAIKDLASQFTEKARHSLEIFNENSLKDALIQLTYFVVNRCN